MFSFLTMAEIEGRGLCRQDGVPLREPDAIATHIQQHSMEAVMSMREFFPWQPMRSADADYQDWLQQQTCKNCGAAYRDRKPGESWVTEFQCGACFKKMREEHRRRQRRVLPCPYQQP